MTKRPMALDINGRSAVFRPETTSVEVHVQPQHRYLDHVRVEERYEGFGGQIQRIFGVGRLLCYIAGTQIHPEDQALDPLILADMQVECGWTAPINWHLVPIEGLENRFIALNTKSIHTVPEDWR